MLGAVVNEEELLAALREYRAADQAAREAQDRLMRAREMLVRLLHEAGVHGLIL